MPNVIFIYQQVVINGLVSPGCFESSIAIYLSILLAFFRKTSTDLGSNISKFCSIYVKFAENVSANSDIATWGLVKNSQLKLLSLRVSVASSKDRASCANQ